MKYLCQTHGKVHIVGSAPRFCPICGNKAFPIFLIPRVFIASWIVWLLVGVFALGTIGYYLIPPMVADYQHTQAERQKVVDNMAPAWRNLYQTIKSVQMSSEVSSARMFVDTNREALHKLPPLKPEEVKAIMDATSSSNEGDIAQLLSPFMVKQ